MLKQARLADPDLKHIAETKSQAHLLALSTRLGISEALSDILVQRGDREVARSVATNHKAQLVGECVHHAGASAPSRTACWPRRSACAPIFRRGCSASLLMQASDVVQKRLLAQAKPETQAEIRRVLAKVTDEVAAKAAPRNYAAALAAVRALHKERKLTEADIAEYAKTGKYEETIAALATMCAVPVEVVDRLMNGERADPVLILARAAGFGWPTVREIINARPGAQAVAADARCRAREFRAADRGHRPARGALLASAPGHRRIDRPAPAAVRSPEDGSEISGHAALRAWPWPRSACRKNPARLRASRRRVSAVHTKSCERSTRASA